MIYYEWIANLKKLEVAPIDDSIIKILEESSFDGTKYTIHKLMLHISETSMNRLHNSFQKFIDKFFRGEIIGTEVWSVELLELKKQMDFSKKIINIPVISDEAKVEFKKQLDKFINDICLTLEKMMVSIDLKGEYNSIYRKIMMNNEVVE